MSVFVVFFFKQKTAYEMLRSLVGSEMCIRDRSRAGCLLATALGREHERPGQRRRRPTLRRLAGACRRRPRLHRVPRTRGDSPDSGRRNGTGRGRAAPDRRGSGCGRGRQRSAVRRPLRSAARPAAGRGGPGPGGRRRRQRGQVPTTRQPPTHAGRGAALPPLVDPSAGAGRTGADGAPRRYGVELGFRPPCPGGPHARPAARRPVSYTHLRAHETPEHLVCRLLLEKKKKKKPRTSVNQNTQTKKET